MLNKLELKYTLLGIVLTVVASINTVLFVAEAQGTNSSTSFLAYDDTAFGISINYPSNWQIDKSAHEFLISLLQNISSSESQTGFGQQNDVLYSKISKLLDSFGLRSVSDIFGLNQDRKSEFLQFMSQAINESPAQVIVAIRSADHEGNLNIVAENISTVSPISLNDYVNASIGGLKILTPDLTIEQQPTEITIDGKPVMTFVYSAKNPLDQSLSAKFLVAAAINDDMAYVLTFRSTPEIYPTYESTYNEMLQSFKITS